MNTKSKTNSFFNLTDYQVLPEAGRSCYYNYSEIIANYCWQKYRLFSINTIVIVEHRINKFLIYFAVKNRAHFQKVLRRFTANLGLFRKMENYITNTCDTAIKHIDKKISGGVSDKELGDLLAYYYQKHQEIALAAMTLRLVDRGVIDYFRNLFKGQKTDEFISILSASQRKTFTTQEHLALLKLAGEISRGSIKNNSLDYKNKIQKIHDSFFWLTLGYYDESIKSLESYKAEIKKLIKNKPAAVLKKINDQFAREQRARNKLLKTLPIAAKRVAQTASEASYLKDYFKFSVNKITYHGETIFKEIAKRTGFKPETIKNLSHQDALDLITKKIKFSFKKVAQYRRHSIFVSLTGKIHDCYVGPRADKYEQKFLTRGKNIGGEFQGRTACRGLVSGYAKIVHSPRDFGKVKKGEIIIVMNTGPDFVPLLHRVGAIVAEEGGITAHVSVISREMGIPCIVGIPRITKNIKNGDYLEINANKGSVKILKRKNN
ncbi:MAG: PEP-utilizing enzyme [Candidatus Falkowbacteria bacterium]|nr:PEP-utilizing enzyme [Candidatus Falkowbacteria bacterium]